MRVGIIGDKRDIHVSTLKHRLDSLHCSTDVINLASASLIFRGEHLLLNENGSDMYDAFYVRQIPYILSPLLAGDVNKHEWESLYSTYTEYAHKNSENISLYASVIKVLSETSFVINPFSAQFFQQCKPYQFYLLDHHGIPIPPYVVTNVPAPPPAERTVCKPLSSYLIVEEKTLSEMEAIMEERPLVMQGYVDGKTVRASILDDALVGAVEIQHSAVDSRVGDDRKRQVISLTSEVEELLFKCLEILNMRYSEIDFILDQETAYILDCNPSPGFMMLEKDAGIPTSWEIARYILRHIRR